MKYPQMHDLKMKDQVAGHENAGPGMRDHGNMTGTWRTSCRKRVHSVISGQLRNHNFLSVISRGSLRDCELRLHVRYIHI